MDLKDFIKNNIELSDLLEGIPDDELNKLKIENYKARDILIKKGAIPEKIFIVLSGLVNVLLDTNLGTNSNIYRIKPTDIFGVSEILTKEKKPYYATIQAQVDTVVATLDINVFLSWINTYNKFCYKTMSLIISRLHVAIDQYVELSNMPTHYKTICYLVNSYDSYVQADSTNMRTDIKILETRAEIADKIGTNTRSVNRSIQQLRNEGLINIIKGKIEIDNYQILMLRESLESYQL